MINLQHGHLHKNASTMRMCNPIPLTSLIRTHTHALTIHFKMTQVFRLQRSFFHALHSTQKHSSELLQTHFTLRVFHFRAAKDSETTCALHFNAKHDKVFIPWMKSAHAGGSNKSGQRGRSVGAARQSANSIRYESLKKTGWRHAYADRKPKSWELGDCHRRPAAKEQHKEPPQTVTEGQDSWVTSSTSVGNLNTPFQLRVAADLLDLSALQNHKGVLPKWLYDRLWHSSSRQKRYVLI